MGRLNFHKIFSSPSMRAKLEMTYWTVSFPMFNCYGALCCRECSNSLNIIFDSSVISIFFSFNSDLFLGCEGYFITKEEVVDTPEFTKLFDKGKCKSIKAGENKKLGIHPITYR